MTTGESSGTKSDQEIWAKLVPSDSRYSDVEMRSNEMLISSEITSSSLEKHTWCKISRTQDTNSAIVHNMSSNTIMVDELVLGKEESTAIKCGSEIIPGPDQKGYLSFSFKVLPTLKQCKNHVKISLDAEHAKCSICLNIWHDVVTVAPCLHNFCNGCFSEWLRRSQKQQKGVLCPQCRAIVHSVGRNHFLHNIEEVILQSIPSLMRSNEELALLDKYASIKSNLVIGSGKKIPRKRPFSPSIDDSLGMESVCPQCGTELGGFKCNQTTSHLQCQACWGMMPSRPTIGVPQNCLGCDRVFCGAYWQAQGVVANDFNIICNRETFQPISERTISIIPSCTHQNNRHEQDITERCIQQMGNSLQDVITDWIVKLNNREIDRTRMPINHADMINAGTHLCMGCYEKLVGFLLYWFRISIPKHLLPPDASKREDCWYGYACRTQHHNDEHAQKRNHVCRPTRGNPGT
ncbi:uncharacterized protein LOC131237419 isoform X2 [Magnolia sinica]|uniref:uncharacterized protein LOC131237419 isoform X2 n=1 Tax=Magnolia sinica TaxID=86752 RepID=UPI0026586004|nr:uncharacterized protein LOC131237419 isoform X2 [Magnolia sinica]